MAYPVMKYSAQDVVISAVCDFMEAAISALAATGAEGDGSCTFEITMQMMKCHILSYNLIARTSKSADSFKRLSQVQWYTSLQDVLLSAQAPLCFALPDLC